MSMSRTSGWGCVSGECNGATRSRYVAGGSAISSYRPLRSVTVDWMMLPWASSANTTAPKTRPRPMVTLPVIEPSLAKAAGSPYSACVAAISSLNNPTASPTPAPVRENIVAAPSGECCKPMKWPNSCSATASTKLSAENELL